MERGEVKVLLTTAMSQLKKYTNYYGLALCKKIPTKKKIIILNNFSG